MGLGRVQGVGERGTVHHVGGERGGLDAFLAELVDQGPLALAQAAAYLVDSGDDVAAYRDLLTDRTTALADAAPDALPDEQTLPLAAAWSLSIGRADTLRPVGLARPLLHLAALLDANGIPQDVLTTASALTHLTAHRARTGHDPAEEPDPVSPRDAVRALRALYRLRGPCRMILLWHGGVVCDSVFCGV
ncbi:hypothetical protein [Streptomyces sp. NBC_00576]|uniref:hypothetical protein n=1 Tax=Streptomyces sp. NBC_00576 TaxID=2903665 RepID=UPI002E81377E|nr:hypothetical protein [Streptomyces sp. NBC_00576]WUB68756.1 hypothetical protein OG734_00795 [Streptomyces sp. NBC_00576]